MQGSRWRERFEMLVPPMPWDRPRYRPNDGPCVVLLHGLWRSCHAMEPLARQLHNRGYSVLNVPYPSTRLAVPNLASHVIKTLENHQLHRHQPIHFVTHSLGAIVLRALIAQNPALANGRVVMLAPPNQGSEIVDWSRKKPWLRLFLGPAGRALASEEIAAHAPPLSAQQEIAVIMGERSTIPWFRKLLDVKNDGIVSVSRGKVPGMKAFATIDADHTFISVHPQALRFICQFLREGTLNADSASGPSAASTKPVAAQSDRLR